MRIVEGMKHLTPILLTLALAAVAYIFSLPKVFGAHPFWANSIMLIGVPAGTVLAYVVWMTRTARWARVAGLTTLSVLGFFVANIGKTRFAASYAEDAFAGQMWYFGWIATCCFAAAAITSVALHRRP